VGDIRLLGRPQQALQAEDGGLLRRRRAKKARAGASGITFAQGSGQPFQVLLTTMWPASKDRPPQSREQLRAMVERGAQGAKAQAVERDLPIDALKGAVREGV